MPNTEACFDTDGSSGRVYVTIKQNGQPLYHDHPVANDRSIIFIETRDRRTGAPIKQIVLAKYGKIWQDEHGNMWKR